MHARPLAKIEKLGVHFTESAASQCARFDQRCARRAEHAKCTKSVVMGKTSLFII